jgi:hypothetical protein
MASNKVSTAKAPRLKADTEPDFFSRQIAEARRFFLRLDGPWPERFNVVCSGSEHCSAEYRTAREDFPYIAVEFVARGEGILTLNNKNYPLLTGTVFAYGPGIPHDIRCRPERPRSSRQRFHGRSFTSASGTKPSAAAALSPLSATATRRVESSYTTASPGSASANVRA